VTYLSRIRINPLRAESRRLLANPHVMHGAVLGGIPTVRGVERVLWRLDADDPRRPHLLVLTRSRPDWTHIVERAGWPDAEGEHAAVRAYAPLLDRVTPGAEFAFRLTANPVQNTPTPAKPTPSQVRKVAAEPDHRKRRGFRLGHVTMATQLAWFLSRTEGWGFEVPLSATADPAPGLDWLDALTPAPAPADPARRIYDGPPREVRITARHRRSFRKAGTAPEVTFRTATYEGRLRVTDKALFTERLLQGIGPSKAYGCGLLTLAPLR
jgi:CRISPR system Cascade subunit CasE